MKKILTILLTLALAVFAAIITTANLETVTFHYISGSVQIALIWIIVAAFSIGAVLSMCVFLFMLLRQQRHIKRLENSKRLIQKELDNLRQLRSDIPS